MTDKLQPGHRTSASTASGASSAVKNFARILAVLAMIIALGFGSRVAFAEPVQFACPYDPAAGELGACPGDEQCDEQCVALFGTAPGGCQQVGGNNCCRCPI